MGKPRIRTVKPEFWTDSKIKNLPKPTALFFIALWNFADDQGILEADACGLALKVPIFRAQDIQKMLNALWRAGLIKRSGGHGLSMEERSDTVDLVMVTHWEHQKIDRPRDGKWKNLKIQWLSYDDSTTNREQSLPVPYRTVPERIGKDHEASPAAVPAAAPQTNILSVSETDEVEIQEGLAGLAARDFIAKYCELFKQRYRTNPHIRGKQAGVAKRVLKDVPLERAKLYLEAFFQMPDSWLVKTKHPLEAFEPKLNEIVVFATTGEFTGAVQARQIDQKAHAVSQLDRIRKGALL
jgi:hypothetical protein